jgi:5,10-methylene-tetrahydrofolate dehydrogenase/methenyl tetrahydrofolate cyclohydrolase
MKKKTCKQIGISTVGRNFPETATQDEVQSYVGELNEDPSVNGILVQLPLPDHMDSNAVCDMISHEKDVDGIHPLNMAAMARHESPFFTPCTPKGIMYLIKSVCPEIKGKKATVIGRSNIVGMPIALLLQKEFATVTLCHTYTKNLKEEIATADIVVSATGCPYLVKGDFIKPGAIVIDVGTQFIEDKTRKKGKRLVGDVDYQTAASRAGFITPVPGGVGPMTIAMLMDNIVLAWKRSNFEHIRDEIEKMHSTRHQFAYSNSDLEDVNKFLS